MATDLQHYSDTWHRSLPLVAQRQERKPEHPLAHVFQTARALGSLAGQTDEGIWSFELGLPPGFDLQTLCLLNCGYRLVSVDENDLLFLQIRPGLFLGNFPVSVVPELFCAHRPVTEDGSRSTLSLGGQTIELTQSVQENRRRVRLTVQSDSAPSKTPSPENESEPNLRDLWESLWKQRMLRLTRMKAEERPVLFDLALEVLESGLHPAKGHFPAESFLVSGLPAPGIPVQNLPGLLPALARMDPDAAANLLQTLCHLPLLDSGAFPAHAPQTGSAEPTPAWPTLAIAVRDAVRSDTPVSVPEALLPRLKSHLQAWIDASDTGDALPQWPQPEYAFTPEIVDDDLDLCDLSALLLAEIDAYRDLSGDRSAFEAPRNRWRKHLLEHHSSPARGVFLDRARDGSLAKRMTLGGMLPLLWNDLPEDRQRGLYRALAQAKGLRGQGGLLQWEPRDDDPAPAPVRTLSQHLFLRPLLLDAPPDVRSLVGQSWARALDEHVQTERGFPPEWEGDTPGWDPLTAAFCLRFAPLHAKADLQLIQYPAWVRFLERQRGSIINFAATLAIVVPISIGLFFAFRPHYSTQQEQTVAGHGETMIALGRFAEAETIYTDLLTRTRRPTFHLTYYAQRGKVRARLNQLEAAQNDLRRAVELDEDLLLPAAHWNLAQVQWRLGETKAAKSALEDFIAVFEEGYPALALRAYNAIALMDQGLHPFPGNTP